MRKTKIVVTLGPASTAPDVFRRLVDSGLDVARINLSHGAVDHHRDVIRMIRRVEEEAGRPVGIMLDTAGPEVRLRTRSPQGLMLEPDARLSVGAAPEADLVPSIAGFEELLEEGHRLVIGDGNLVLEVVREGTPAVVRVVQAGRLPDNKKVTSPGQAWALPVLTAEDVDALQMGIEEGIDWVAASFIRQPEDVVEVRRQVESWGGADIPIMAKIETKLAMENLDTIVRLSDGLMVARGDLGVEYPPEDVPWLQKQIIDAANAAGKPVVTATQMLESMIRANRPTRAEVTDIAHAVLEGSDAVMLSEETAVGDYPVEAVTVMARAALASEAHPWAHGGDAHYGSDTVTDAVCHAALTAAEDLKARLIVTATESGHTAQSMAAHRPRVPILAVTPYERVARRLTLVWGLNTQIMNTHTTLEGMVDESVAIAAKLGWATVGDRLIVTAGAPVGKAGSTNVLRVVTMGEVLLRGQGLGPEGEVHGLVAIVRDCRSVKPEDVAGKVLVVPNTDAEWTPLMEKARAIVVEAGGLTSHAAIIGISLGIPTIIGVADATTLLANGQPVAVDAVAGAVLQGRSAGQ
jgi:pyruvate kinase